MQRGLPEPPVGSVQLRHLWDPVPFSDDVQLGFVWVYWGKDCVWDRLRGRELRPEQLRVVWPHVLRDRAPLCGQPLHRLKFGRNTGMGLSPLLGCAVADALGKPFETKPSTHWAFYDWDGESYLPGDYPNLPKPYQDTGELLNRPGVPTDVWLPDPKGSRVTMMVGLPGAGKSRWLKDNAPGLPVVSLDALRDEMDVAPTDKQGSVVQAAKESARQYLRAKKDFAWDATNLTQVTREHLIALFMSYDARVRVVYVEVPLETLRVQNSDREHVVPWGSSRR